MLDEIMQRFDNGQDTQADMQWLINRCIEYKRLVTKLQTVGLGEYADETTILGSERIANASSGSNIDDLDDDSGDACTCPDCCANCEGDL